MGLLQAYVTHKALAGPDVQLIYTVCTAAVAFAGSYLAPHQSRGGVSAG